MRRLPAACNELDPVRFSEAAHPQRIERNLARPSGLRADSRVARVRQAQEGLRALIPSCSCCDIVY